MSCRCFAGASSLLALMYSVSVKISPAASWQQLETLRIGHGQGVTDVCIAVNYACACIPNGAVSATFGGHDLSIGPMGVPAPWCWVYKFCPLRLTLGGSERTAVNERRDVQKSYTVGNGVEEILPS